MIQDIRLILADSLGFAPQGLTMRYKRLESAANFAKLDPFCPVMLKQPPSCGVVLGSTHVQVGMGMAQEPQRYGNRGFQALALVCDRLRRRRGGGQHQSGRPAREKEGTETVGPQVFEGHVRDNADPARTAA